MKGYKIVSAPKAECPQCHEQKLCSCCGVCLSCKYEDPFCKCGHPDVFKNHKEKGCGPWFKDRVARKEPS